MMKKVIDDQAFFPLTLNICQYREEKPSVLNIHLAQTFIMKIAPQLLAVSNNWGAVHSSSNNLWIIAAKQKPVSIIHCFYQRLDNKDCKLILKDSFFF
ncbi:hypothetical protein A4244_06875 [Bacillus badius]|nr:hypothetical protein A4244_06875 [Bacillus badius]OCS83760.1 hypothetical protein A6M11_06880 [Bacillus badius]OVE52952.1 hypothetical protein B1A98_04995 [Bacillus badius]